MPKIQQGRRRVGGSRVRQPEVPQGFFTDEFRAEAAGAAQRQRSATEGAQADIQRAGVIQQGARLADNIGELATNIAFRDAQNLASQLNRDDDINQITTQKKYALLAAEGAYSQKDGKRAIVKFASDYTEDRAKQIASINARAKDLPAVLRDDLDAAIKLRSTKANLRISLQQAGMVQDAGAADNFEKRQWEIEKLRLREQDLKTTQDNIKSHINDGISLGHLPDNPATARSRKVDLNEAARADKNNIKVARVSLVNNFYVSTEAMPIADAKRVVNAAKWLTTPERNGLQSRVKIREDIAKEQLELAQESAKLDIVQLVAAKDFNAASAAIQDPNSVLDSTSRRIFTGWIRAEGNQPGILETTDPGAQLDILHRIDTDPESVTPDDIYALVGKGEKGGLSVADAGVLVNRLASRLSADQTTAEKDSRQFLTQYEGLRIGQVKARQAVEIKDEELTREEAEEELRQIQLRYVRINAEFDEWFQDNPKATDEEIRLKIKTLTEPIREDIKVEINTFWNLTSLESPFRDPKKEQETRLAEQIETLDAEGVWDNWTFDQQQRARELLDRRWTRQAVIEYLDEVELRRLQALRLSGEPE